MEIGQIFVVGQGAGGQVAHQNDGQDDFVGGPAQNKGGEDYAVHSHQPPQRIEKGGKAAKQRDSSRRYVG